MGQTDGGIAVSLNARSRCNMRILTQTSALADLGFLDGGDFGNSNERSIEGVWAYGRMTFERL